MDFKQISKTMAMSIVASMITLNIHAQDYFNHNGIRYKIESFANQELRMIFPGEPDYTTTELVIPATIRTKQGQVWTVTAIGEEAFGKIPWGNGGYKKLKKVSIPKTVKTIHRDAFKDSDIEEITADCPTELHVAEHRLKEENFRNNNYLKTVNLGANANSATCRGLTRFYCLQLSADVDKPCFYVQKITLNPANKNLVMVDGVLYNKSKTELLYFPRHKEFSYVMPSTVKTIPRDAFCMSNVTSITLSPALEKIEEWTFSYCKKLKSVIIPGSVKEIEGNAFCGCISLENIKLSEGLRIIGSRAFSECYSLQEISIPQSLNKMESQVFVDCKRLKNITIPSCATKVYWRDFQGCKSLEKVVIPESVNELSDEAFLECNELKYIYCYAKSPNFKFPFYPVQYKENIITVKEIHVPKGCKSAYESSDWKRGDISIIDDLVSR